MNEQPGELVVQPRRELARRVNGGIEVALYWSPLDNRTTVEVWDVAADETLVFDVPAAHSSEHRSACSSPSPTRELSRTNVASGPPPIPVRRGKIVPG